MKRSNLGFWLGILIGLAVIVISVLFYKWIFGVVHGSNLPEWAKWLILRG